jgi:hypothetical protein
MNSKTKRKPPTAAEYNRLQRELAAWRQCANQLLQELITERIDSTWRWRSPGIKQYDRLSQRTRIPWPAFSNFKSPIPPTLPTQN